MQKRHSRPRTTTLVLENLEDRVVLSGATTAGTVANLTAEVASKPGHKAATSTALTINAGTLGQPITFNVKVHDTSSAAPQGTVELLQKGKVIQSVPVTASSTSPNSSTSQATYTLNQQPGGSAYYFGKYPVTAKFIPSNGFSASSANKTFTVTLPNYTTLADGVKVATIANGSGPAIQSGQSASVLYTGYLASNGHIFDDSVNDGGPAFNFTLGAGQVITGFNDGVTGMQVGETRVVEIPASEGYGSENAGSIPPNSTLIFVMTLTGISTPTTSVSSSTPTA